MFPALPIPVDNAASDAARHTVIVKKKPRSRGVASLLPQAGTGGELDLHYWRRRQALGYPEGPVTIYVKACENLTTASKPQPVAVVDQIALVRQALKPSMLALANAFGVTRQTLYNWNRGDRQPDANHQQRLDELAAAAQILLDADIAGRTVSRRKIKDGKNLLELAQAGEPASEAANRLVAIIHREATQRARLEERLAKRRRAGGRNDLPGIPMLDD